MDTDGSRDKTSKIESKKAVFRQQQTKEKIDNMHKVEIHIKELAFHKNIEVEILSFESPT